MDIYGDEQRVIVCWEAHIIYMQYTYLNIFIHINTIIQYVRRQLGHTAQTPQVSDRSNIDMYQHVLASNMQDRSLHSPTLATCTCITSIVQTNVDTYHTIATPLYFLQPKLEPWHHSYHIEDATLARTDACPRVHIYGA